MTDYRSGYEAGQSDFLSGFGFIPEYWGNRSDDWLAGYEAAQDELGHA